MFKKCFGCQQIKSLRKFYLHKGMKDDHLNKCKFCIKKDVHKRYFTNHKKSLKREHQRYLRRKETEKYKIYRKKYYEENIEKIKILKRNWSKRNKKKIKIWHKIWLKKNSYKRKAHSILNDRVRRGIIKKENCFCGQKGHAHHPDYFKPLEVQWFCPKHHREIHKLNESKGDSLKSS